MFKRIAILAFCVSQLISLLAAAQKIESLAMTPGKEYSWWYSDEPVVFEPNGIPGDLTQLDGVVFDVSDQLVGSVSVNRSELESNGWVWEPADPGFYEVEFYWRDAAGQRNLVKSPYWRQAPSGQRAKFERSKFSIAVVDRPDPSLPHVGQFGFHYHLNPAEIPLAELVGFDFAFIHSIPWGSYFARTDRAVEPERDVYDWSPLDSALQPLFDTDFEIGAQIMYTPAWASPHPEKVDEIKICIPVSASYAPKDMGDLSDFVAKVVERYQDHINIWEIWNEPAMPGGSVFWSDTPENYVKMLQAGYEAVKRVQPDAEVWNGGIGMRPAYYAFYDRILRDGASPYFDKLSLHARYTDLKPYRDIEDELQVPQRPAVMTEWHAILINSMSGGRMESEPELSMRMMRDLLIQLKQGVVRTVIFEMTNQSEKETLHFARANHWHTHSAGLFRKTPHVEPRHAAVVMATFLNQVGREAIFNTEVLVGKDGYGLLLETNESDLLVIWSEQTPVSLGDVREYASERSVLYDWEGKAIRLDESGELALNEIYYLTNPSEAALENTEPVDRFLPITRISRQAVSVPTATYSSGEKADEALDAADPWIDEDWNYVPLAGDKDESFEAEAKVVTAPDGIAFIVRVHDVTHVQEESHSWWRGDSLQFAIDCEGRGMFGGQAEYIAALTPGRVVFHKLTGVNTGADLPPGVSPVDGPVLSGNCDVTREGNETIYRVFLPWSELYPMVYDSDGEIRLSYLVNRNDGAGRAGYLTWGGGIGGEKDPSRYGKLKRIENL